ncbi:DAK2 domain-containing protein [Photobacterium sp. DNB23_23_1]
MKIDNRALIECAQRLAQACRENETALCEADARLGDGDLGLTMSTGWRAIASDSDEWSDDCSKIFFQVSKSLQRSCASSFGTLQATGFMSAAKYCKSNNLTQLSHHDLAPILDCAWKAMADRGKGELGKKSVLDIIYGLSIDLAKADIVDYKVAAKQSVDRVLAEYRDRPNGLGRARMFAEKSIGVDDPGMLAVKVLVNAV